MEESMNLCGAQIGGTYRVVGINLPRAAHRRLAALGLTAGTRVTVLNNKRSGSVIFNVRGTRLAVGRGIAENIRVASA